MIKPREFEESNNKLTGRDGVNDLEIYATDHEVISCWNGNLWDRISFLFHGKLWLVVQGDTHPPLFIEQAGSLDKLRNKVED